MGLGSVLSSRTSVLDPITALRELGDHLFPGFGTIVVLISTVALISIMGINAYAAILTSVSGIDAFKRVPASRNTRIIGLSVIGLIIVTIALLVPKNYLGSFNNTILLMLYFLIPWTAVNLVDFYWVRHGKYAITEIFNPKGIYGRWSWRGLVAYFAGFFAMIPFISLTGVFTGPIAAALGGADLSFAIALIVAGTVYYLLARRGIDHEAEAKARHASQMSLEGRDLD